MQSFGILGVRGHHQAAVFCEFAKLGIIPFEIGSCGLFFFGRLENSHSLSLLFRERGYAAFVLSYLPIDPSIQFPHLVVMTPNLPEPNADNGFFAVFILVAAKAASPIAAIVSFTSASAVTLRANRMQNIHDAFQHGLSSLRSN